MNRRKSSGRITAEEANELFQKPLELLDQPNPGPEPRPASNPIPRWAARRPRPQSPASGELRWPPSPPTPSKTTGAPTAGSVSPLTGMLQAIRSAAERLLLPSTRETDRQQSPPPDSSTADLATRLEKSLVEASCLAAELQRRHREALAEHQRALSEIRDMVTILVEQVDRSAAVPPGPGTAVQAPDAQTRQPAHVDLINPPSRARRRPRLAKSTGEDAG